MSSAKREAQARCEHFSRVQRTFKSPLCFFLHAATISPLPLGIRHLVMAGGGGVPISSNSLGGGGSEGGGCRP